MNKSPEECSGENMWASVNMFWLTISKNVMKGKNNKYVKKQHHKTIESLDC